MKQAGIQQLFFQHLKKKLAGHVSLADEVADVLEISIDSAYRRIRGEKQMTFEEIGKLCGHYKLSLDNLLNIPSDSFIFSGKLRNNSTTPFDDFLDFMLQNFQFFKTFSRKHLYILMKDIPAFVHFQIPELAAFKFHFWMKTILHYDNLKTSRFSINDPSFEPYHEKSQKILTAYLNVPTTEIWNIESLNSTIRQINFYHESGYFDDVSEVKIIYKKVIDLIDHLERQAEYGKTFRFGDEPQSGNAEFRMYVNELILGDNTFQAELDDMRVSFLNHSVIYFIATRDERFNQAIHHNLQNLIKKSTMVSLTGEKERVRFFNKLREKVQQRLSAVG